MRITTGLRFLGLHLMAMAALVYAQQPVSVWDGVYIPEQAAGGKAIYDQQCSQCHGTDVLKVRTGGAPNLTGSMFMDNWNGLTVSDLFEYIKKGMPRNDAGRLTREQTANIVAFIFTSNGFPAGQKELPIEPTALKTMRIDAAKAK